ncbi:glutamate synthase [Micromonospora globispora]|uniref:NAD(P)-binding protein n=1 Tax=Micromonospora globispora TaxID=1450148 RepID=UPI000D6F3C6F|nr:NAD(P)-binding protein [Micromonospora globispora]PWU54878.1 glutamate synthase [Micromonospora globispora]
MTDKPFAITLGVGSSLANHTGTWRVDRPVYVTRRPPCADACPAGEDPQRWLYRVEERGYEAAWREIMTVNPFPAVIGRVCYHPCQSACNRGRLDEAVGINAVERFLGDEAIRRGWTVTSDAPPTGRRVLVIGAGPAGLSAAYHLRLLGHDVTVRDRGEEPGGMMRYGIPAYRLPRDVLDAEIARIVDLGVRLDLRHTVTDLPAEAADFDAVFVAVGAQLGRRVDIPAGDGARVLDAVTMLHRVADGQPPQLGRRVVVYGGGNTAMDAARSARRIGATDAVVVYRRTRDRMPAHEVDLSQALDEGITVRWLSTITQIDGDRVRVEKMRLDDSGFPQPTGEYDDLSADAVVLAVGQEADLSLLSGVDGVGLDGGTVRVGPDLMTGHAGVFAGGDIVSARSELASPAVANNRTAVRAEQTVTNAVGQGRGAASAIDAYLKGRASRPVPPSAPAGFERLNTWYYCDAPATVAPGLAAARRVSTFDEVVGGLDESTALFEARRCLSCGTCFECDNCYGVCPDNAIRKLGPGLGFEIDYDYCKGCGLCVAECPAGAMEMVPEQARQ